MKYFNSDFVGAWFIGNIRSYQFKLEKIDRPDEDELQESFPFDMYFMDHSAIFESNDDGKIIGWHYEDSSNNNTNNTNNNENIKTEALNLDVFVTRLLGKPEQIKNYFNKLHAHRENYSDYKDKNKVGAVFLDNDFAYDYSYMTLFLILHQYNV